MDTDLLLQLVEDLLRESFTHLGPDAADEIRQSASLFLLEQSRELDFDLAKVKPALVKHLRKILGQENGHAHRKCRATEGNGDDQDPKRSLDSFLGWLNITGAGASEAPTILEAREDLGKQKERALYVALRDLMRLTLFCLPSQVEGYRLRAIFELWLCGFNYSQIADRCRAFVNSKLIVQERIIQLVELAQGKWGTFLQLLDKETPDLDSLLEAIDTLRKTLRKTSKELHPGGTRALRQSEQHDYEACKWLINSAHEERRESSIFAVSREHLGNSPLEMLLMRMRSEAHTFVFDEHLRPKKAEDKNLMAKFASAFLQLAQFSILCMPKTGNPERGLVFGYRDWAIFQLHMRGMSAQEIATRLTPQKKRNLLKALKASTIAGRIGEIRKTIFAILGEELVQSIAERGEQFDLAEGIRRLQEDATQMQRRYKDLFPGGQRSLSPQARNDIAWLYSRVDLEGVRAQSARARAKMTPEQKLEKSRRNEQRKKERFELNPAAAERQCAKRNATNRRRLQKPANREAERKKNRTWQRKKLALLKKDQVAYQAYLQHRRELRAANKKKKRK